MKKSTKAIRNGLMGLSALAFGLGLGLVTTGAASAQVEDQQPPQFEPGQFSASDYDFEGLTEGPTTSFPLEMMGSEISSTVLPDSVRLLHSDETSSFYSGLTSEGLVCIVVFIPGSDWMASANCGTPEQFNNTGIGLRAEGGTEAKEAYFLPDAMASQARNGHMLRSAQSSSNLLVTDPYASESERDELTQVIPQLPLLASMENME